MKNLIIIFLTLLFVSCNDFKISDISCKKDATNCPKDYFCNVDGKCVTECSQDSECLGGFACVENEGNKICKTICSSDRDCLSDYVCGNGECRNCKQECPDDPVCLYNNEFKEIVCCDNNSENCYVTCKDGEKYSEYDEKCISESINCSENKPHQIEYGNRCKCDSGYSGKNCFEINECLIENFCGDNSVCLNEPEGSFTCNCNSGYEMNGNKCEDINECLTIFEKCSEFPVCCDVNAVCNNMGGSFTCDCKDGYVWDIDSCINSVCGNTVIESPEECEGNDFNGNECNDLGYSVGTLSCDLEECFIVTTDCRKTIQIGSSDNDDIRTSYIDENGNIYIAFSSLGTIEGCENSIQNMGTCENSGGFDIYISKYNSNFQKQWVKRIGTSQNDFVNKIILYNDFIYISGNTAGEIPLNISLGGTDVFIAKLDLNGNYLLGKQFGNENNNYSSDFLIKDDIIYIVNNIFISDSPTDAILNAVNLNNFNIIATATISTPQQDYIQALFIENNNIWITGYTNGNLAGIPSYKDIFLAKYNFTNNEFSNLTTKQFGTLTNSTYGIYDEEPTSLYVKGDFVYISGYIMTELSTNNPKAKDILILVYDNALDKMYYKQIEQTGEDKATQIFVDDENKIYVSGFVSGSLSGNPYLGNTDAFIAKYSFNSTLDGEKFQNDWVKQFGTASTDFVSKMIIKDKIYLFGNTMGALDGNIQIGGTDIFITTYDLQ